ncbi:hypothetical protein CLOSTMETH_03034, partial [[Clostridium] methylpentosum DSM 5476]
NYQELQGVHITIIGIRKIMIKAEISKIFHNNKNSYGYRRITQVLKEKDYTINHKTV